ncbi:hypothetical protein F2P81_006377 [Scophthalmus maximus]|uniref:Uncharacterized protein n=1 Tax=Scophthalmus maximus TaxID=52904 RepID=A0A6A4T6I4_SCOMX|nr:hypothetical protein F2P81_006377 [Scophthalmus maximus]
MEEEEEEGGCVAVSVFSVGIHRRLNRPPPPPAPLCSQLSCHQRTDHPLTFKCRLVIFTEHAAKFSDRCRAAAAAVSCRWRALQSSACIRLSAAAAPPQPAAVFVPERGLAG